MFHKSPMHNTTNPPGQIVSAIPAEVLYMHLTHEEPMEAQVPAKFGSADVLAKWMEWEAYLDTLEGGE